MREADVMVIGTGTAGTTAAGEAHRLGKSVTIAEEWLLGGLCNTRGCIPTKTLLRSARAVHEARAAERVGVRVGEPRPDFAAVMQRARDIAHTRSKGSEEWLPTFSTLLRGTAEVVRPGSVRVGDEELAYKALVLAAGSEPFVPPIDGLSEVAYHTSDTIWGVDALPRSVAMIGAGAVAVEFACFFSAMGSRVTMIQRSGRLLAREDDEVCAELSRLLVGQGIEIRYETATERVEQSDGGVALSLREADGSEAAVEAELLLVATGRRPKLGGLRLDLLGVEVGPRGVTVDERARTTAEDVYAAGDIVGHYQLTDVAYHEGKVAGINAAGGEAVLDERVVPRAIFSIPEIGSVGLTEEEARERHGDELIVGVAPMTRVGKAQADANTDGVAKIVALADGTVVGAHFLGGPAGELVQTAAMAMVGGVTLDELKAYIPIHPTYSEILNLAALRAERAGRRSQ